MEQGSKAVLRDANSGSDHAFIYSTWRNALWYAKRRAPSDADAFYKALSEEISRILKGLGTRVNIACLSDDPDMLLGWSVIQDGRLEFVYVKRDYRGKGIGRLLCKGFKSFDPPETKIGKSLVEKFLKEQHGRKEEIESRLAQPDALPD
jgi:GNAT superfamily N-acetyltransferase